MADQLTTEQAYCVAEAECIAAAEIYFGARSHLMDTAAARRIFEAGFKSGKSAEPVGVPTVQAGDWQQYAKEGESAQDVIERERKDNDALCTLLARARSAAPSQPVAVKSEADCYSHNDGDSWCDCPDDIVFVHGLKVGDEYEVLASVRAWPERYRVTKAPDDDSDEYEVELITTANAGKEAKP